MQAQARAWQQQAARMVQEANARAEIFAQWVEKLAVRDPQVSVPAIWALHGAGVAVIPVLIAGLQHEHIRVRRTCVDIIDHGGYGGDGRCIEALLPLLHDPVPHIRRAVWHTLFCERCQDESQCVVERSGELDQVGLIINVGLRDENTKLRRQLVADLVQLGADPRVAPALTQMLETETDEQIIEQISKELA